MRRPSQDLGLRGADVDQVRSEMKMPHSRECGRKEGLLSAGLFLDLYLLIL